jgi:hypothetical protein
MKFKNNIIKDLNSMPDFIDPKSELSKEVWNLMVEINDTISELISLRVLSKNKVFGIARRFNDYIEYTMSILDKDLKLTFSVYYTAVIQWIKEEAIKEEQFETAANIDKFENIYYKIIETEDDLN